MERMGVGVLSPDQGLGALQAVIGLLSALKPSLPLFTVNPFNWQRLSLVVRPLPRIFREFEQRHGSGPQKAQAVRTERLAGSLSDQLSGLRSDERVATIQTQVSRAIAAVRGAELAVDEPLMDAGLDSLAMAEVSSSIVSALGVQLPSTVAFDYPSIGEISIFIDSQLFPAPAHLTQLSSAMRVSAIQNQVGGAIAAVLGRELDPDEPLMDAGLDSLGMAEISSSVVAAVGVQLPSTVAFDYPSVAAISQFIHGELFPSKSGARLQAASVFGAATTLSVQSAHTSGGDRRTAVIGMGMRMPRTVSDCQALWQMVATGGDAIMKVPMDRWDVDLHTASGLVHRRRDPETESYSRHGSFVEGIDLFDNGFFAVSAADAAEMDPQQRVLVQVCAEALYLGGLERPEMRNSNTAVIIGICNNDFDTVLRAQAVELTLAGRKAQEITDKVGRIAYSTYAFAANRVSHTLGLVGASLSVDTASASALVATHMATQEARKPGCNARAVSGGVNLVLHPSLTDLHTARKMFPKDGRCKTFDAAADGFERGEGSAAVCQRLLSEASADGDAILAVVLGSTTIHKGGGASLRAMRGPAIQHKVRVALADAQMQPDDLRYIEASGLGEPYGDAVEVGAYQALFQPGRRRDNPLIFGSIHTNIGHLDGASGIVAFAKAVMLVQQQAVPPIVHFKTLHPLVTGLRAGAEEATRMGHTYSEEVNVRGFPALFPMGASPLAATSQLRACPTGVSAFGFGGTMAHLIVDGQPHATVDRVRAPLRYSNAISFPWQPLPGDNPAEKFQARACTCAVRLL